MSTSSLQIYCENFHEYVDVNGGETLLDVVRRIESRLRFKPICARVNNKTEGLQFQVFMPKIVEFIPPHTTTGERVYVRSLCMMLYKAVDVCLPGAELRIEHSVSRGYYCTLRNVATPDASTVARLREYMNTLAHRDIPFERHEQTTPDVISIFEKQKLTDKVKLLKSLHTLYTVYYSLEGLCDSYYSALAPSTGYLKIFNLQPYQDGMLLLPPDRSNQQSACEAVRQDKMFRAFTDHVAFNNIVGVSTVGEFNEKVADGDSAMVINISEALHNKSIAEIADAIAQRHAAGGARVVLIAGPSSSGKTTFTKRLAIQLMTNLLRPKMISLDNYFVNRDLTPRDDDGDFDYESLYALDLETFNRDMQSLLRGETVTMPYYNFERGCREYRGETMSLDPDNVLLIEGIHGLNPELTSSIPQDLKFRVYVSALTTISIDSHNWIPTTDNRLMRRIIRDNKYRGVSAVDTIRRWPSVRRGEERWIFPYQENADAMFNSSLLYELAVMRQRGEAILESVPRDIPEYAEAYRLRRFLSYFTPVSEKYIPSTSLLREFLGGSSFHY